VTPREYCRWHTQHCHSHGSGTAGAGLMDEVESFVVAETLGRGEIVLVGCGVGLAKVDVSGDRGECGEGGMLSEDDLKGTGVILRPILVVMMMLLMRGSIVAK